MSWYTTIWIVEIVIENIRYGTEHLQPVMELGRKLTSEMIVKIQEQRMSKTLIWVE